MHGTPIEPTAASPPCRRLEPADREAIAELFDAILADPERHRFRPHPFDRPHAERIADHGGLDLYVGAFRGGRIIAYGMLRGWDEQYEIPSLGLYVRPEFRGGGWGRRMLDSLHELARGRRAPSVRLTVDRDNPVAFKLYERAGYIFRPLDADRLVGLKPLS
jgi:ribosomal protein S18 acetylase RimI-like enzyme